MNRFALSAMVAVITATWGTSAQAFVREESNWNPASFPISYSINLSSAPSEIGGTGARTAVEGGFATWAGPACTSWRATDAGDTARVANQGDRANTITWVSGSWPATLGDVRSVIGVTTPVWTTGGYFIDADIQFNAVGFTWSLNGATNTVDTQSIATHEEGHFLGLGHPPVASAIMYASYSGGLKRVLASDDTSGVCTIYPSGTTPPPTDAGTATGTGGTGSPCGSDRDCTSSICVNDGSNTFCSKLCTDDCACPGGFSCVPTTSAGVSVCAPGANGCSTGRDSGTTPPPGGGTTGDSCAAGNQCASGICAHAAGASTGFCTRACYGDATCPCGYQCFPTTTAGTSVCGPGADTCVRDGGVTPVGDSGTIARDAALVDARRDVAGDVGGDAGPGANNPGCGCTVPGMPRSLSPPGALAAAAALAMATRRRRRR